MNDAHLKLITSFIDSTIDQSFYSRRRKKLSSISISTILRRKNPYLYKSKGCKSADELIRAILNATLDSGEESSFGDFLESVAVRVCEIVFGGRKSGISGVDLEFEDGNKRYLIAIKSGPNWGNSAQIKDIAGRFTAIKRTLQTSGGSKGKELVFVEGCCYGVENVPARGTHHKLCGQAFWELISGSDCFYKQLIEPLEHIAAEQKEQFDMLYNQKLNLLTKEFLEQFCDKKGVINWDRWLEQNSGKNQKRSKS